jgi:cytochrome d ubiquinol oxidase subunit I
MRTAEAVTPMRWLIVPFTTFTIVYLFLAFMVVYLLCREFLKTAPAELQRSSR